MTVVFAVVTRTFNEDKLMILSTKNNVPHGEVAPPAVPTRGAAGTFMMPPNARNRVTTIDKAETIANRDDVDDDARSRVGRRRGPGE